MARTFLNNRNYCLLPTRCLHFKQPQKIDRVMAVGEIELSKMFNTFLSFLSLSLPPLLLLLASFFSNPPEKHFQYLLSATQKSVRQKEEIPSEQKTWVSRALYPKSEVLNPQLCTRLDYRRGQSWKPLLLRALSSFKRKPKPIHTAYYTSALAPTHFQLPVLCYSQQQRDHITVTFKSFDFFLPC